MEIFKNGRKAYVTVYKTEASSAEAVKIANDHFKVRKDDLEVTSGTIKGDILTIGRGKVWVVSRKESK